MIPADKRFGIYEILGPLGAGGMGEVYRARDTKLGREVALKLLPDTMAHEPDRLARFEREAHLLASLNHPNIGAIYGFENDGHRPFLVLELVPGDTLAERLAAGPLDLDEALPFAIQIAQALEAAHEKGIVHRDLKPANLKITPENQVKVLDFGLGKTVSEPAASVPELSASPTRTIDATRAGVILGTAHYMSPEQARGKPADRRSDIWSFGCVLFEMLTGRRAFHGETVSDILAGILRGEPEWSALPSHTPPMIRSLLRRCLRKEPGRRLQHIGDARLEIEESQAEPAAPVQLPTAPASFWKTRGGWLIAALATVAALAAWGADWLRTPPAAQVQRFSLQLPAEYPITPAEPLALAISPDGTRLAYIGLREGQNALVVHSMDRGDFTPLAGTGNDVVSPAFSPDGAWLVFHSQGKIKRMPFRGGAAVTIHDAPESFGFYWSKDDSILFMPSFSLGIARVPAAGGVPQTLYKPDWNRREASYLWPQPLPGNGGLLFTVNPDSVASLDDGQIAVRTDGGETRVVLTGGSYARYVPTGHLVYAHNRSIMAVPFDAGHGKVLGNAVGVVDGVMVSPGVGSAQFAFSNSGTLAYLPGVAIWDGSLVSVSRRGDVQALTSIATPVDGLSLSSDGRRLALRVAKANDDIHIFDLERGTMNRFTFEGGDEYTPVWSPDGKHIVYTSTRGAGNMFRKPVDSPGEPERLLARPNRQSPASFSPDGKLLAFAETGGPTGSDIWVLSLEGRTAQPFLNTQFEEASPHFSPDGHWLAYSSNESGVMQIFVAHFPDGGGKTQISSDGGIEPQWAPDGRELFYVNNDKMMSVSIATQPGLKAGKPQELFSAPFLRGYARMDRSYVPAPDGQHFLMVKQSEPEPVRQIHIVLNWFEELKRKVAEGAK